MTVTEHVKNFTWRLAKDILPTRANLRKKGTPLDDSSPFCHMYPETSLHPFLHCDFSKRVFFSSPSGVRIHIDGDMLDWISDALVNKDIIVGQMIFTGLWKNLQARNNLVFNSVSPDPCTAAFDIWDSIEEVNVVCGRVVSKELGYGFGPSRCGMLP